MKTITLIIPAAGIGKRFSNDNKKQFVEFDGKPLIYWTIKRLFDAGIHCINIYDYICTKWYIYWIY